MSAPAFDWTEAATARLREQFDAGMTSTKAALALQAEFGGVVTRNTVIGKRHRLGMVRGLTPSQCSAELAFLVNGGKKARVAKIDDPSAQSEDVAQLSVPGAKTILNLESGDCRWPLWEGRPSPGTSLYCGVKVGREDRAYCAEHHALAYQPRANAKAWDKRLTRGDA